MSKLLLLGHSNKYLLEKLPNIQIVNFLDNDYYCPYNLYKNYNVLVNIEKDPSPTLLLNIGKCLHNGCVSILITKEVSSLEEYFSFSVHSIDKGHDIIRMLYSDNIHEVRKLFSEKQYYFRGLSY